MSDGIEKAHALADGELSGAEKQEALDATASDPQFAAEYEWALLFKGQLREKLAPIHDEDTWQTCKSRLNELDKVKRTEGFVGKYAWAFCLIFLVGIFSAAAMNRMGFSRPLGSESVAGLFHDLTPFKFSEPSQAIADVRNKVGRAPQLSSNVARVTNVASGVIDGRRVGRLTLDDGHGQILLFVVEGASGFEGLNITDSGYRCGSMNDLQAVSWTDTGYLFMLVGPRNMAELKNLAEEVRSTR